MHRKGAFDGHSRAIMRSAIIVGTKLIVICRDISQSRSFSGSVRVAASAI
jgi:hypothetical protein